MGRHGLSWPRGEAERRLAAGRTNNRLAWALKTHHFCCVQKASVALVRIHQRPFNFSCRDCVTVFGSVIPPCLTTSQTSRSGRVECGTAPPGSHPARPKPAGRVRIGPTDQHTPPLFPCLIRHLGSSLHVKKGGILVDFILVPGSPNTVKILPPSFQSSNIM